jgi:hypothetical protein
MKLQGLPVDRSTLAFWVGVAAAELKPIYRKRCCGPTLH